MEICVKIIIGDYMDSYFTSQALNCINDFINLMHSKKIHIIKNL